jgi:threonine/homoserine/homoserine lactone efflux protein
MASKSQDLGLAAACFFFLLLSLAGLAAIIITGEVNGVDSIFMLIVCAGMALLFAWLTFSALRDARLLGAPKASTNPGTAPAETPAATPTGTEGKQPS